VKSDVIVYSVVNTLCELPNVTKVQITIDGEQQQVYGDTEDFNTPFERNLNMIQGGAGLQG
jgi:germination protein M